MLIAHQLYRIFMEDKNLFLQYSVICIVPFLMIYLFFQVISLPGFTQLETKHGMLLYPMILAVIVKSHKYLSSFASILITGLVLIGQLIGMYSSFNKNNTDWETVVDKVNAFVHNSKNVKILKDGRSNETYRFYNRQNDTNHLINYTWESLDSLESVIMKKNKLVLLLNDYKSYTPLSLAQNWNAGKGSYDRFKGLEYILERVNHNFYLMDSYVNYPTFLYLFERKSAGSDDIISAGVWEYHLKDLILPLEHNNSQKIKSSILVNPGDSIKFQYWSRLVINLEQSYSQDFDGDTVGIVQYSDRQILLVKGENIWDLFAEFNGENIYQDRVFHSWYHRPLVSGSIKYHGSYFRHKAHIYSLDLENTDGDTLSITNKSKNSKIRIWTR